MKIKQFKFEDYIDEKEAFHFARKDLDSSFPEYSHTHNYYELFLVEQGSTIHKVNGKNETLNKGALVFVRPNDVHAFKSSKTDGCRIINIMFGSNISDHLQSRYGSEWGNRFFWFEGEFPDTYHLTGPRLERAINASSELQVSKRTLSRIEQFLLYIMTRVIDYSVLVPHGMPIWLREACHSARNPEVLRKGASGFVEVAGRGHEHVCRVMKIHIGVTPSVYMNQLRMEHAAMNLGSSDMSILDVSLECGIENLSHFYKLFREYYGNTPKQYQKLHRIDPVQRN
jgi:AraC family cel operon transcriptional repressor